MTTETAVRRTCVVTGSASGIGRATAARLTGSGHRVIGVDRRDGDVVADLSTSEGRAAMVAGVSEQSSGVVDAVVAAAGIWTASSDCLAANYFGAVATLEGLRPLLAKSARPRAAVVSSIIAIRPSWPAVVELCLAGDEEGALSAANREGKGDASLDLSYRSSKVALLRWMRRAAVSEAWGGSGIVLNAVAPGTIATPMNGHLWSTAEARAATLEKLPAALGRIGQPEEVAELLAFLVSAANSYVVAQVLFADGGTEALLRGDSAW
jgi:NAD(P)-dependent dehydrogenase (short-subunit alcohol dehydrogenase family)